MKRSEIKKYPLADTTIEALEPEAQDYRVRDGGSLYLKVDSKGKKSWQYRYKTDAGKWAWAGIGGYPLVSGTAARKKAAEMLTSQQNGKPVPTKTLIRQVAAEEATKTFESLAREWHTYKAQSWTPDHAEKVWRALEIHVLPTMGSRPYEHITPHEWHILLKSIEQKDILTQLKRIYQACGGAYALACATNRATTNPVRDQVEFLRKPSEKSMKHVEPAELPDLMRAMRTYQGADDVRIALQLLALFFCRPSELRQAHWEEFDMEQKLWTIPAHRKGRKPKADSPATKHIVPLSRQAIALLTELHALTGIHPMLFPGRNDGSKSKSDTVFLMALRRLGYGGRQTGHGFRHIASTAIGESGAFLEDAKERQLSHKKKGTAGKYDFSAHLPERIEMMQWWADYLDAIDGAYISPKQFPRQNFDADNVVKIKRV